MIRLFRSFALTVLLSLAAIGTAYANEDDAMQRSVEQLRASIGHWKVVTEFLNEDGSIAKSVEGAYRFEWVVPERVVSGRSDIPEMKQTTAILFYVNEQKRLIEMVSVAADGRLWVMSGPLGGEVRTTPEYTTREGGTGQLRFTRFNVAEDSFESRMEYSEDSGKTWKPGNHQTFRRAGMQTGKP
jgi:hypothetical protein